MRRRLIGAGLIVLACAALGGTALAAPAGGGRHFPHFSLLNERVAVKKLPLGVRLMVRAPGRARGFGLLRPDHGSVWFGEVERPNATITAVGQGKAVCAFEESNGEAGGGGGECTTMSGARELGLVHVGSCGRQSGRHFRISGLVPDGVTGLALEKGDGTVGRTVPVLENTFAFTVGHEDITLRGVGDPAAEGLERILPLGHVAKGGGRGDCSFYAFTQAP
jgi:hypothetical protein